MFAEVHPNPDEALSDGPNMIPLSKFEETLEQILTICKLTNEFDR